MKKFVFVLLILFFFDLNTKEQIISLEDSINNIFRTQLNRERDIHRNPKKTLEFFEIDKKKKFLRLLQAEAGILKSLATIWRKPKTFM